jgi:hypothetical protein
MAVCFAILVSVLMAVCSISLLGARLPIGGDQTLTYFLPTCYPLSQVGWHDAAANQFFYLIVLGWPNGFPLHSFGITDDQSEFMRWQRFADGIIIGVITLTAALVTVALLEVSSYLLETKTWINLHSE